MSSYRELFSQGETCTQQQRWGDAVSAFTRASELEPDRAEPLSRLGTIFMDLRDFDNAGRFFERAAERDEKDAYVRLNLGLVRYAQGRLDDAAAVLEEAAVMTTAGVQATRALLRENDVPDPKSVEQQCRELEETADYVYALIDEIRGAGAPG